MDDLGVLRSPQLWPSFPYLRVERRREHRPGSPFCFVRATADQVVEPFVLMGPTWPPEDEIEIDETYRFAYDTVEEIAAAGWKVVYMF